MDIKLAASLLGGKVTGINTINFPTPGHSSRDLGSVLTFVPTAPDGFVVHSHNGYPDLLLKDCVRERLGIAARRDALGIGIAAPTAVRSPEATNDLMTRLAAARSIWNEAMSPVGTPVETYLATRGLELSLPLIRADQIRFHPHCRMGNASYPAMIAKMRDNETGAPFAIHRTALLPFGAGKAVMADGGEAKRMLGRAKGSAIRLGAFDGGGRQLGIAEGIESALSVQQFGYEPIWAVGSSIGIKSFLPLEGLERLEIFADSDEAGLAAARDCAVRLQSAGIAVRVVAPPAAGADWNDLGQK